MMGDGCHRAAIVVVAVLVIRPDVCIAGMWVEACPCMPSSDDIDLSGLVYPPPDVVGAFPITVTI